MIYIKDWITVFTTLFTVWFKDCLTLERRLRFMEDAVDEKRKKQLPYRIIKFLYYSSLN